jgi:hypothetical protein
MRFVYRIALLAVVLTIFGCGGMVPVEGVVLIDGEPAPEGVSVFLAPTGNHKPAHSKTGPDGKFRPYTKFPGDGMMPGEYKVVLVTSTNKVPLPDHEFAREDDPAYQEYLKKVEEFKRRPPTKGSVPYTYGSPETTPLKWKIPEDGKFMKLEINSGVR